MSRRVISRFPADSKGSVAVLFGLVIPALIGFTGLAVDGSYWLVQRNKLQAATDSAAISVAQVLQLDGGNAPLKAEATKLYTKIYGSHVSAVKYEVEHPPKSGPNTGDMSAVAVLAERSQNSFFLSALGIKDLLVKTRAVARIDSMAEACLLGLSPTDDKTVEITGSTIVNLDCGIASNSNSTQAMYLSGSSQVSTSGISTVGDIYQSNGSLVNTNGGPMRSHAQALRDPYGPEGRNLQVPTSPAGCTGGRNLKIKNDKTLSPGRYCGGIDFQSGTATLSPGVYIIDSGDFNANAQASITGTGVTIILTGSGTNYAQMNINGGAAVNLQAPTTGSAMKGVLFFQDPAAPTYQGNQIISNKLNGGSGLVLNGALYFPKQRIDFSGGAGASISCLQMIGLAVTFTGNSRVAGTCDTNDGTESMRRVSIKLTE
jgi:Putative Flp pilus-assembly TadE/G-like